MTRPPPPTQLGPFDDAELERLATFWRAQALRGNRAAYGIAHALEVERRRRLRVRQSAALPSEPVPPPRPWWKFWSSADDRRGQGPARTT